MNAYKILKIPVSKDKAVFYYYKQYEVKDKEAIATMPEDRTLHVCHFQRPIEEATIQKYFGAAGKIQQVQIGEFRNKANKKSKRRTLYFALVVYKKASDAANVLSDSKMLQGLVNKICKRMLKTSSNPFNGDSDGDEKQEKDEHTKMMEDGGFTMVEEETEGTKRGKATDGVNTVQGVTQAEAENYYKYQQMKQEGVITATDKQNFGVGGKNKRQQLKSDFYKFQFKEDKKSKLEELRTGFEDDKRRLAKMLLKSKLKDAKNKKTHNAEE